ncbi:helix-turn-helix domain-containing protein [Kineococcus auxinigenes]|uniref:helix-turn-helix domain-containing protein n=1 Tax=unclassified Kineococcus TaxID=2621656 RepID=UPI003D7CA209
MSTQTLTKTDVVTPTATTRSAAVRVEEDLDARTPGLPTATLRLPNGTTHEVPEELVGLLMTAIRITAQGDAVAISTVADELTTSEAAALLGVSRPTMTRLVDTDQIPGHKVGSHRRVFRKDVVTFRSNQLKRQRQAAVELMQAVDALGLDED